MSKEIIYSNLYKNIHFGLYQYESIKFEESKTNILEVFKNQYGYKIEAKMKQLGLELIDLKYYSPKAYNYESDDVDTIVRLVDKDKLKQYILENEDLLNEKLSKNKSYDGYISLTVGDVNEELKNLVDDFYEPDIVILKELLNMDCSDFDITEYIQWE